MKILILALLVTAALASYEGESRRRPSSRLDEDDGGSGPLGNVLGVVGKLLGGLLNILGGDESQSINSPHEADQLIDQLLKAADQDQDADSTELDPVQIQFRQQRPPRARGQIKLSQGQLSGITSQAQRDGQSRLQKQGDKRQIQTPIKFRRLRVQYQQVDIETQPDQGFDADSLQGQLHDVRATLKLQYDQETGELIYQGLQVQEAQESHYTLKGAEQQQRENPEIEEQADREIQKAVARALRHHLKQILQEAIQSSK